MASYTLGGIPACALPSPREVLALPGSCVGIPGTADASSLGSGASPWGLGVREEMLVPGRHQDLLSSTCHGEKEKGPVSHHRDQKLVACVAAEGVYGPECAGGVRAAKPHGLQWATTVLWEQGLVVGGTPTCTPAWLPRPRGSPRPVQVTLAARRKREAHLPLRPGARA